jgi:hypothetical protein
MILDILHFLQGTQLDIGAVPLRVVEQGDQFTTFIKIEPHQPRLV